MPEVQDMPPNGPLASGFREGTKAAGFLANMSPTQVITLLFVLGTVFIGLIAGGALYELKEAMIRAEKRADERDADGYLWQAEQAERNRKFTADERAKDRQTSIENIATLKKIETAIIENTVTLKKLEAAIIIAKKGGGSVMDP